MMTKRERLAALPADLQLEALNRLEQEILDEVGNAAKHQPSIQLSIQKKNRKNIRMARFGRMGGLARAKRLSARRRREIAAKAAAARWTRAAVPSSLAVTAPS